MPVEAFQEHWRTVHADLVVRMPGLLRYLQNHTHESGYRKHDPDYDAVAEVWLEDARVLQEATRTEAYRAVREIVVAQGAGQLPAAMTILQAICKLTQLNEQHNTGRVGRGRARPYPFTPYPLTAPLSHP